MSNIAKETTLECAAARGGGPVELFLTPKAKDLGGFSVRRTLPSTERRMVGPWIFFDHMGPAHFAPGPGIDVRPHPHIGIATVTYLFEGEMLHRDSLGSLQAIRPGDINLMVSGSGIVHSERERPEMTRSSRTIHGLQLWLALPLEDEEAEPAFHHYAAGDIPAIEVDGVPVRVMIGSAYGVAAPVRTFAETLYIEAQMEPDQTLAVPQCPERAVYVVGGGLRVGGTDLPEHTMAVLSDDNNIQVESVEPSRVAIIGGERLDQRYIDWNFVSSRKERIARARQDWQAGRFAKVPGDKQEYIPLPD